MAERDLDAIRRELVETQERLASTPKDDFGARTELRSRQQELREEAAALRAELPADRGELEAELARLRRRRAEVFERRVPADEVGGGGGAGGGGIDGFELSEMNRAIDEGNDLPVIEARIAALERRLDELES